MSNHLPRPRTATSIVSAVLTGANLSSFSENLRQYAQSLNDVFPKKAESVNKFIADVDAAAGNKAKLEEALSRASENADQAKQMVKESELGGFMRGALGKEYDTTTGPYAAFTKVFLDAKDGVGRLTDLQERLINLPEARRQVVQDGMETAYMRMLAEKVNGAKMVSGGSVDLKGASVDGILSEGNQILEIGRLVFKDKPDLMDGLSSLLEVSRMIGKGKGAIPVASMSPTAFNKEALQATNRLIMLFIGPLSRTGARLRAGAGAVFDKYDQTKRAEVMLDNIFANPDKFLELSRKFDADPTDPAVKENLLTGLTTGFIKGVNAEQSFLTDQNNVDQQMMDLLPQ